MKQTENRIQSNSCHLCNAFGNDYYNINGTNSCVRISGYLRSVVTAGDNGCRAKNLVCGTIVIHGFITWPCISIPLCKPHRNGCKNM
ncbi:porin [uncultured Bartonella sp.]|uniref:porin n=1 Tax=uncultured Bartonella sp. TaxID=104108 RepID=UPI00345BF0BD